MKFTQNTPVVNPTTIGNTRIRAVTDPMAYGTAGKEYEAMAGALGQVARVAKQQQDDMDAADHMTRRNNIMGNITKRLYGEDGLITNGVGINAKGLTDRVQQVVQEEFERGMEGANQRVRRSMAGTFNENMGNYQRIAAQQEGREFNRQKEIDYNANQGLNIDRAVTGCMDNNSVNFAVNDGLRLLQYRAKDQGWSNAQLEQEKRKLIGAIGGSAIQAAIDNNNLEQAGILLTTYGPQMDQAARMKFENVVKKNTNIQLFREKGAELLKRFGSDKEKAKEFLYNVWGVETETVGGSNDRFVRIAQKTAALIRQKIPNASPNLEKYLYGQMVHETGHFTHDRALANNNFAGLHGGADGRHYANDDEYIQDYASFFTEGYHGNAVTAASGKEFAQRLSQSGWFTDPNVEGYGNNIEASYAEYDKKAAAGGGGNFDEGYNSIVGNKMDYGEVGCVEAVVKGGKAAGIPFFEKQSAAGVVDCDTLKQNASAAGIAVEDFDPNNPPRKGDVIIYDRGEKQHAVTADGNGGYWGNSSSQGKVVHGSDYNEMDGKIPTQVIRTGQLGGSGSGGYTKKKYSEAQLDGMWRQYEAQLVDHNQTEAYKKSERVKSYIDGAKGMTSQSDVVAYMDRVKADPSISIDDYNKIAGSVFGYYGLTRDGNAKGTRGGSGTGGGSSKGKVHGENGYYGKSGKWYTMAQYEEAKRAAEEYKRLAELSEQGLYTIGDRQSYFNKETEILNDIWDNNYTDNVMIVTKGAFNRAKGDFYGTMRILQEEYGMAQDEAARYINHYLGMQSSGEEE